MKCGVHIFTGSFGSPVHLRTRNNWYCVKCGVHVFSGSFGSAVGRINPNPTPNLGLRLGVGLGLILPTAEPNEPARLVHG